MVEVGDIVSLKHRKEIHGVVEEIYSDGGARKAKVRVPMQPFTNAKENYPYFVLTVLENLLEKVPKPKLYR